MMVKTYGEWLKAQTRDRQQASLHHMDVCRRHGELQRTNPSSDECAVLAKEVAAYYAKWRDHDASNP